MPKRPMLYLILLTCFLLGSLYGIRQSILPKNKKDYYSSFIFQATRLVNIPIIHTDLHTRLQEEEAEIDYPNIIGPYLIRLSTWIQEPWAKFFRMRMENRIFLTWVSEKEK